jgi:Mg2+ and Co2+ transporter CorA
VSILLAERENAWGRQAQIQRQETSTNQLKIIEYQTSMLEQQEIIVAQTKRDNTVMKVIAVLSALFLPGTFIAVSEISTLSPLTRFF